MKRILYLSLGIWCFFFTLADLNARHIIGGELTYDCLGYLNDDPSTNVRVYQFYMNIYRDCLGNGANFDSAGPNSTLGTVTVYQGNNPTPFFTFNLSAPAETSIDPDPGNPCVIVPPNICVEQGIYTFPLIELPVIDESYFIVYQRCCRNVTINNIFDPGDSGATYFMELTPLAQQVCNDSPTYDEFPPIVLCANESFTFDHGATDPDGDQLVYSFCPPFLGGGPDVNNTTAPWGVAPNPDAPPPYDEVAFIVPDFSFEHPLGIDSELILNPTSGKLTGTPAYLGQFVVGICVSEYRNGELLSVVRRDFQFNVTNCEVLVFADIEEDAIINGSEYLINSCGETSIDLVNQSFLESNINSFKWEFFLDGSNITTFTDWNPTVNFPGFDQYLGRLILNPGQTCGDTATIRVNIFPEVNADFSFTYDTCTTDPVLFNDLSSSPIDGITNWRWNFGDGLGATGSTPQHLYRDPGDYTVNLAVEDVNGCTDEIEKNLAYYPIPNLIIIAPSAFEGCVPASIQFNNLSEPINEDYLIDWDFGDGGSSMDLSPTHVFTEAGTYSIRLDITSPIGCETDTTFFDLIQIDPAPIADFRFTPEETTIFDPTISFFDESSRADRWFWNFNGVGTSIDPNPVFTFPDTGLQKITLIVESLNTCRDTLVKYLDIEPVITFHLPNAFTPNDDSKNDVFKGVGYTRGVQNFEMSIWNRWGERIFVGNAPDEAWNGRKNNSGGMAPNGVYTYIIKFNGPRGMPHLYKGIVTLVR